MHVTECCSASSRGKERVGWGKGTVTVRSTSDTTDSRFPVSLLRRDIKKSHSVCCACVCSSVVV